MRRYPVAASVFLLAALTTLGTATPARAQAAPPPAPPTGPAWEVEFHGGLGFLDADHGTHSLPSAGPGIAAPSGFESSRAIPSWFFGDGPVLFNGATSGGGVDPAAFARLGSLDSFLTSHGPGRATGGSIGVRVTRRLTRRLSMEFSVDDEVRAIGTAAAVIESERLSFVGAFKDAFGGLVKNPVVSATSTAQGGGGSELVVVGALTLRLVSHGRTVPYVEFGGGILSNRGSEATLSLIGHYQFDQHAVLGGSFEPIDETDALAIRYSDFGTGAVAAFGGGLKHYISGRSGVRVDGQILLGGSQAKVAIDATPSHVVAGGPATLTIGFSGTSPTIQFSSSPDFQSSLSAPLVGFQTFNGRGLHVQAAVTFGYFLRF